MTSAIRNKGKENLGILLNTLRQDGIKVLPGTNKETEMSMLRRKMECRRKKNSRKPRK